MLFPLLGVFFPWLKTKPREGKFLAQSHAARQRQSSDSNHNCPALGHTRPSVFPALIRPPGSLQEGGRVGGGGAHSSSDPCAHRAMLGRRTSHLVPHFHHARQVAIQDGHRDTELAVRPAPQAADKEGSVFPWVACLCWLSQGRGRSGGPRKRIFIPSHFCPHHSSRGACCATPSREPPTPGPGGARAALPLQGPAASLWMMDGGPREAVTLATAPSPRQLGGPRGARQASPAPSPTLGV